MSAPVLNTAMILFCVQLYSNICVVIQYVAFGTACSIRAACKCEWAYKTARGYIKASTLSIP